MPDDGSMRIGRLAIFAHLWAIAGFCEWTRWTWTESEGSVGLLLGSLALAVFPGSVLCLGLFAVTQMTFALLAMNAPWNHGLFMAFVNLAILLSIARWAWERRRDPSLGSDGLVDLFAPAARLSLVVLYLFTFFHKLNADFLDPGVSCAGVVLGWVNEVYRVLPVETWSIVLAIGATLFAELAVPVLLCFRRTAVAGLLLGAGFHLFLSQAGGLHGFAAMLFALYFLFLPRSFTAGVAARIDGLLARAPQGSVRLALPLAALGLLALGWALGRYAGIDYTRRGLLYWDVWLLGVVVVFGRELVGAWRAPAEAGLAPRWAPLWAIPLLVAVNGLFPYVGLKTETSWAMYSNLRTEVRPNHLIVPESVRVFGFQQDWVEVLHATSPELAQYARGDVRLHVAELRHLCSEAEGDFELSVRWRGQVRHIRAVAGAPRDSELCRPLRRPLSRLLDFRPIDVGPHARCRH